MTKKLLSLLLAAVLLVSACIPVCALDEEPAVTCEREVYPVCETVAVSWQAVSGAHTYDLHLFSGRIMVRMLAGLTELSAALSDLSAGNYTAEVYAYTDTGTELCGDVSFSVGDTAPLAGCRSLQISDGEYLIRSAVDGAVLAGDAQGALITEEYAQGANTAMRLVGKRNYRHEISTRDYNRANASGTEKGAGYIFAVGSADNLNEFFIIVQPDGSFIIELAEKQGYCLTAVGGAVTLEPFNGSRSQKFSFCDAQGAAQPVSLRAPGSIEVYTLPAKTEYIAGESFVFAGLVLTHTYNTGVKERVKTGFTVDCDTSSAGKKTATVSCGALKTKFEVNVIPVQVVSIKMETLPDKLTYKEGEAFLPQGTSIRATYNNGTQLVHTRGLEFYGYTKTPGVKTITVSYEGAQTSFEVSVAPGEVSQLVMIHEPNKTQYYVGEELDLTGLSVAAKYTTGHTQVLSEYIIEGSADSAGYKTIVVSFAGKQTSFGINVIEREVEKIRILTLPQKQIYLEGDSFDPTGITVEAVFSDGTHKQVKGFEMYGYSRSATGLQTIHVNYKDAEAPFTVYITPPRATRISVTAPPSTTQ
ncbi:MAG: hypothetical protein GX851_03740, partial [Clostridiales bacterium]|nr:hypothetical protein [Clostridiales bacterium]